MKAILGSLATFGVLLGAILVVAGSATSAEDTPSFRFGMEASSVGRQSAAGVTPDYGSFWIGPWTLSSGWAGPDNSLASMKAAGVTPAIHFYYWGDDISPACVENGCWSDLHDSHKNRAGWERLGQELVNHLDAKMGGAPVVIFLESEFNKGGVEKYEPFDGYMATMANFIKSRYPAAQIVLGFGNWGSVHWQNFDRAAAASDYTGIQGMRGSTRQNLESYGTLYEGLQAGANKLHTLFGKPIILTDIALSSYPEPGWLKPQADGLKEIFDNLDNLKAVGVEAMVYRSWKDSPGMDLKNHYGEAERHWGVAWAGNNTLKPAAQVWIQGVKAERANAAPAAPSPAMSTPTSSPAPAPAPATSSSTPTRTSTAPAPTTSTAYAATFTPGAHINEWWIEVTVKSSPTPAKVQVSINGAPYVSLEKQSWGTWADSLHAAKGSKVVFKATSPSGASVTSQTFTWLGPAEPAFTASFKPRAVGNDWWVEVAVTSQATIAKVEAREDGGAWTTLPKTDWGSYGKSIHVENGHRVTFRATSSTGATQTSAAYTWT